MEIISLVLSIVALSVASYFALMSHRREQRSHDRDNREYARRIADQVACWATPVFEEARTTATVHIRNGGAQPIRSVHATIRPGYVGDHAPAAASEVGGYFIGVLGPNQEKSWQVDPFDDLHHEILIASGTLPLEVSFTDSDGQLWTRGVDGILVERDKELGGFC